MNKIRIIGKDFTLIEDGPTLHHDEYGYTDYQKLTISYSSGQAPAQVRDTVLHEVIHAIDYSLHLNMEEEQVHALAAGLLCVLKDNPELTKWLLEEH